MRQRPELRNGCADVKDAHTMLRTEAEVSGRQTEDPGARKHGSLQIPCSRAKIFRRAQAKDRLFDGVAAMQRYSMFRETCGGTQVE